MLVALPVTDETPLTPRAVSDVNHIRVSGINDDAADRAIKGKATSGEKRPGLASCMRPQFTAWFAGGNDSLVTRHVFLGPGEVPNRVAHGSRWTLRWPDYKIEVAPGAMHGWFGVCDSRRKCSISFETCATTSGTA